MKRTTCLLSNSAKRNVVSVELDKSLLVRGDNKPVNLTAVSETCSWMNGNKNKQIKKLLPEAMLGPINF